MNTEVIKLKAQSALGNTEAMMTLGNEYLFGIIVQKDISKGYALIKKAADKGLKDAIRFLKDNLILDKDGKPALSKSFEEVYEDVYGIKKAAHDGNAQAQWFWGIGKLNDESSDYLYMRGWNLVCKAAKQGLPEALFSMGVEYVKEKRFYGKKEIGYKLIKDAANKGYIPAVKFMLRFEPESMFDILAQKVQSGDAEAMMLLSSFYLDGVKVEKDINKGFSLLEEASEKGCGDASYNLAITYEFGEYGKDKNINKAIAYYEKGVSLDDSMCMNNLANILEKSDKVEHDYKKAFLLYKQAAESGCDMALNNLATCYKRGIGTDVDAEKALEYYVRAADAGVDAAYENLYRYYFDGICTEKNPGEAVSWVKKGAELGIPNCAYYYACHLRDGNNVERNWDLAKKFFSIAAEKEHPAACMTLANYYRYTLDPADAYVGAKLAFEYYEKASRSLVEGMTGLAQCYTYGIGTQVDYKKAVELYTKAAEAGDAQAQFDLGVCYRQGEGVEADIDKAIELYQKAIEQGHGGAMTNMGVLYDNAIGVDENPVKALEYYKMAAEAGHPDGQCCAGIMYYNGRGTEQNYEEAVKWFTKAAEQGEPDSMYHLALCYIEGHGVEKNNEKAVEYLRLSAKQNWQPALKLLADNGISV